MGAIKQKQVLNWVAGNLELRGHLKGYTSTKRIASDSVRPLWLHLLHTLDVICSHALDAVKRSGYRETGKKQTDNSNGVESKQQNTVVTMAKLIFGCAQ